MDPLISLAILLNDPAEIVSRLRAVLLPVYGQMAGIYAHGYLHTKSTLCNCVAGPAMKLRLVPGWEETVTARAGWNPLYHLVIGRGIDQEVTSSRGWPGNRVPDDREKY